MIRKSIIFLLFYVIVANTRAQEIDTTQVLGDVQDSVSFFSSDVVLLSKEELAQQKMYTSLELALKEPDKVYKLSLREKNLKLFPLEIVDFPNLQYLDLYGNKMGEIPVEIEKCKKLQYLDISYNQLTNLPVEIGTLINLEELYVKYNQLLEIPREIGGLLALQKLDISHNRLVGLPDEIMMLESLIVLYLKENNFSAAERDRIRKMRRQWLTIYLN